MSFQHAELVNFEHEEEESGIGRDTLLVKCRGAIESLHEEIEEERALSKRLTDDKQALQLEIEALAVELNERENRLAVIEAEGVAAQQNSAALAAEIQRLKRFEHLYVETNAERNELKSKLAAVESHLKEICDRERQVQLKLPRAEMRAENAERERD